MEEKTVDSGYLRPWLERIAKDDNGELQMRNYEKNYFSPSPQIRHPAYKNIIMMLDMMKEFSSDEYKEYAQNAFQMYSMWNEDTPMVSNEIKMKTAFDILQSKNRLPENGEQREFLFKYFSMTAPLPHIDETIESRKQEEFYKNVIDQTIFNTLVLYGQTERIGIVHNKEIIDTGLENLTGEQFRTIHMQYEQVMDMYRRK